jgi:hypothetical protein
MGLMLLRVVEGNALRQMRLGGGKLAKIVQDMGLVGDTLAYRLNTARLTNTGLTAQQYHLTFAGLGLLPAPQH